MQNAFKPVMVDQSEHPGRFASATTKASDVELKTSSKKLDRLAWLLDSSIRLPGGHRIGIDGLIGLIPGFGDAVGAMLSLYIVSRASSFGVPKAVLGRMLLNVGIDSLIGLVPVLGDLFDFVFKANERNVKLLRHYVEDPTHERRVSWLILLGIAALLLLLAVAVVALGVALARWLLMAMNG